MGAILRALGDMGYGYAYRVLEAQWFGVPQRRRRVFIVGCLGNYRRAAEVLFERDSLPWDSPPSREAGARVAAGHFMGRWLDCLGKTQDGYPRHPLYVPAVAPLELFYSPEM